MAISFAKFSTLVRERRAALGWSQDSLANLCGTHQPIISLIETGRFVPDPELVTKLADKLGIFHLDADEGGAS